ncbi:hypothetical protein [Stappia sp. TSB10GB4]|uniref:hypothetical protein n=1 Tax=Stappia sp. TSB10GB4 TaxID=2003584 RepID=UPI001646097C|nr:hypothetical protein [Stappia sp. TSB10GB4]
MTSRTNRMITLSTEINRCLFDEDLEQALRLIGGEMQRQGLAASPATLAEIPVRDEGIAERAPRNRCLAE